MAKLNHLFHIGQSVKCRFDDGFYNGTVKEVYEDHLIVDVPEICDHCLYKEGFNMDMIYPDYN